MSELTEFEVKSRAWASRVAQSMLSKGSRSATATCPACETEGAVRFTLEGTNNRLRGFCGADGCTFSVEG